MPARKTPTPRSAAENEADRERAAAAKHDKGIRLSIADAVDMYVYRAISPEQFTASLTNRGKAPDVIAQAREACEALQDRGDVGRDHGIETIIKQLGG